MNSNAESHNDRLDRMAIETQNSNELLSSIKQNTSAITTNTGNTSLELGKTNELLFGISKKLDGDKPSNLDSEILGELEKLNNTDVENSFDPSASSSFYESAYEDGFQGVWDEKNEVFSQTGLFKFLDQFKFSSGGTAPDMTICFDVLVNLGCKSIDPNWSLIMPFLRICIFLTAVFVCRRIIFGG